MRNPKAPPRLPSGPVKKVGLDKREFMQQYVLNRSATLNDNLSGQGAAEAAEIAWETIEKACAE